jgi:cytidylate kinase
LRSRRRAAERTGGSEEIEAALHGRDARDARTNPHQPAPGAVVIDTSELDADETLEAALDVVRELAPELMS